LYHFHDVANQKGRKGANQSQAGT